MGPDDYSDDLGDDDFSDDELTNSFPAPAERQWRHPSEMAAEARAAAAAQSTPLAIAGPTNSGRMRGPLWITAAGLVVGIVMVGLIQSSRATAPPRDNNDVASGRPDGQALITIPNTTAPEPRDLTPSSVGVSTTYTSPTFEVRVARPEGLLTVFAADRLTVLGSAVATDNMILTSASSISGHKKIYVSSTLGSASMWEATLLGTDGFSDLAVFTCEESLDQLNLDVSALGEADPSAEVTVISGGDALLTSAASGKVLQLDTSTRSAAGYRLDGIAATSVETTKRDAGAGLFSSSGALLGIVVDTNDHLAAVLPIEDALGMARSLTANGWITPNWAGFRGSSNSDGIVVVESVELQGPAELAGIQTGDLLIEVDGLRVTSMADLVHYMRALEAGSTIELAVSRNNELVIIQVPLGRETLGD